MKNYKVVISLEFPDGSIEYVIWEPELYGKLAYMNADFESMFYDTTKNNFQVAPVDVLIELYDNPQLTTISSQIGDKVGLKQLLVGERVLPLKRI